MPGPVAEPGLFENLLDRVVTDRRLAQVPGSLTGGRPLPRKDECPGGVGGPNDDRAA